ncbi:unnamed protein product [Prunus armeniaca]|nr:unnamed protein product [Prunus armeniaca]
MVQNGRWYLVGKGGKPGKELTNTQARRIKRQYGKARREMEHQSTQSSPPRAHQATRKEFQREGRSTVGMLRLKGAPESTTRTEQTESRPYLGNKKAIEGSKLDLFLKPGHESRPSVRKCQDWEQAKAF